AGDSDRSDREGAASPQADSVCVPDRGPAQPAGEVSVVEPLCPLREALVGGELATHLSLDPVAHELHPALSLRDGHRRRDHDLEHARPEPGGDGAAPPAGGQDPDGWAERILVIVQGRGLRWVQGRFRSDCRRGPRTWERSLLRAAGPRATSLRFSRPECQEASSSGTATCWWGLIPRTPCATSTTRASVTAIKRWATSAAPASSSMASSLGWTTPRGTATFAMRRTPSSAT